MDNGIESFYVSRPEIPYILRKLRAFDGVFCKCAGAEIARIDAEDLISRPGQMRQHYGSDVATMAGQKHALGMRVIIVRHNRVTSRINSSKVWPSLTIKNGHPAAWAACPSLSSSPMNNVRV